MLLGYCCCEKERVLAGRWQINWGGLITFSTAKFYEKWVCGEEMKRKLEREDFFLRVGSESIPSKKWQYISGFPVRNATAVSLCDRTSVNLFFSL